MKLQYLLQPIAMLHAWVVRSCYRTLASGSDRWDYVSQFGICEQRIALSAMPWLPIEIVPLDLLHSADVPSSASPVSLDPHAPSPVYEQHLAPAHQQMGWNQVQSQFGLNGQGQTVAIIDSGIAFDHVALGRGYGAGHRVVGGWDFAEGDNRPYDDAPAGYHGTHVAGIVGANDGVHFGRLPLSKSSSASLTGDELIARRNDIRSSGSSFHSRVVITKIYRPSMQPTIYCDF